VQLARPEQEDAAQHQLAHHFRVTLRVGERQRAAPRAAEHLPAADREVLAQRLDVRDQVPRGVVDEAGVRRALAAAALIEQHDAMPRRIPEAAVHAARAATRPTMQKQHGLAVRVAVLLVVNLVQRVHAQTPC
jgi:hypothetical protein